MAHLAKMWPVPAPNTRYNNIGPLSASSASRPSRRVGSPGGADVVDRENVGRQQDSRSGARKVKK